MTSAETKQAIEAAAPSLWDKRRGRRDARHPDRGVARGRRRLRQGAPGAHRRRQARAARRQAFAGQVAAMTGKARGVLDELFAGDPGRPS